MSGKLSKIVLFAAMLGLACCSKPEPATAGKPLTINGQIFVIQKDRVNIKLGGVEVRYVPREAFQTRCRWIEKNGPRAAMIARYEQELRDIDSVIEATSTEDHAGKIRRFLSSARELQNNAWSRFRENPALESYRLLSLAGERKRESFEEAGFPDREEQWTLSALFSEWLDRHAAVSTKTDADGNYSLNLPAPGNGFVFAQTSREVSEGKTETYFWIQEVSPSTTGPVHLSTNDVVTPAGLDELIYPGTAPAPASMNAVVEEFGLRDLAWFAEAETLLRKIAKNEDSVAKLKSQIKEVEDDIEKTKYIEMSPP
jgi:hypothetical protein